ncbi:hypothetical protein SuNHUV7_26250 (plasmid) [Pseudoseohaeicola sp. NH-UV-7]|uniref:TadE/TadG family type IV pilus assembly protein n=1 Tax=Sulfitobacter sp. TBRI5 TaxID=2989732 RepID=UPI003A6C96AE
MNTLSFWLKRHTRRFSSDETGNIAIEATIVLPIMFWAYLSLFSIFDAYRQYTVSQKAAYTISDLISRQTTPIDNDFLDSSRALFDMLTRSSNRPSIRLTILKYDEDSDSYEVQWSKVRGSFGALDNEDVDDWHNKLPVMPDQENVIVFESVAEFDPLLDTGLENRTISNFVFTRPRYAPQVLWQD